MSRLLRERVTVARRFQRAVRIDTDIKDCDAIDGFVCPNSSAEVLTSMARHIAESGHCAFTWTGPYGSGKSSLVVALSALLSSDSKSRDRAVESIGVSTANSVLSAMPPGNKGWMCLPVVGRRDSPVRVLGKALEDWGFSSGPKDGVWTEEGILDCILSTAESKPKTHGGLIVFIDEMGKFLEAAVSDGSDIYLFQQLAEASARSKGRLLFVGVLHQSFEEYANRLSRTMRDEWAKIQGRFIDLAVNVAGEEQVELISRAIEHDHAPETASKVSREVARLIGEQKKGLSSKFAESIEGCWPLHPVVACLLGPISRRRFGQNQRSIFGFLNSAEIGGFRDFLAASDESQLYEPDQLWDYLRLNLEPAILSSPDGHRWALAAESIERCEGMGCDLLNVRVLKTLAVIDLFKERSGLLPGPKIIQASFPGIQPKAIRESLAWLQRFSFIIYKKFLGAYAIYAGSDFDIDAAVEAARESIQSIDFDGIKSLANLQPLLAKRHYHETGALRWFDVDIAALEDIEKLASSYESVGGAIGKFVLVVPSAGTTDEAAHKVCRKAARLGEDCDFVFGYSTRSRHITELGTELLALEKVRTEHAELAGDSVARREVLARLASVQTQLEAEIYSSFNSAEWFVKHRKPLHLSQVELSTLASELAGRRFAQAPILRNEMLNRSRPSSNAIAARNTLLRRMVMNRSEPRLGIEGFPAEGGLYVSLLEQNNLHSNKGKSTKFVSPLVCKNDPGKLAPLWRAAIDYLKINSDRTVALGELYELWGKPPYGVRDGLMAVLSVAFLLTVENKLAVYRRGVFQASTTDLDVDYLIKDPWDVQVRWMKMTDATRQLLSGLVDVVRDLNPGADLNHIEAIDVARALVAIYVQLPSWTKRTTQLSANAKRIRDIFKRASDPNKFLFDDIPLSISRKKNNSEDNISDVVKSVHDGLAELLDAYPTMLRRFRQTMFTELRVPNDSPQTLAELRNRANNIRQLAGDFRLDALVGRLTTFSGAESDIEGLVGLAADKPPRDCVDPDIDRAIVEIADMAQRFVRAEAFAHVKGRIDKRHSMAVIVGSNGQSRPLIGEFGIADYEQQAVDQLFEKVSSLLCDDKQKYERHIILAALAQLSTLYLDEDCLEPVTEKTLRRAG